MNVRKFTKSAWVRLPGLLIVCLMLTGLLLAQAPAIAVSAGPVVTRTLPDTVEPGETFDVTVTFTSDADAFNAILLTDLAPAGWDVSVDTTWCTPNADAALATDNKAEITWNGPYSTGTPFTAVYEVTVPGAATPGVYTFPDSGQHFLRYYADVTGPHYVYDFAGDDSVEIEPDISVTPTSKDFGDVYVDSSSSAQTFTVSNDGTADLVVGTITITGGDAGHFAIPNDNCSGQTIAPTDSATLQVVFSPTSTGTKTAQLSIPSNDPDEPTLNVTLEGTGTATGWGKCGPIDLVIVLDDTGSMGGAIGNIIAGLPSIIADADTASGGDLRLGYITFNDDVHVRSALTDDIDAVKALIEAAVASGGAGWPEASDEAKNTAVNNLPAGTRDDSAGNSGTQTGDFTVAYRSGALKIVVLITDAPPGGFNDVWDAADTAAMHTHALTARDKGILMSDIYVGAGNADVAALLEDDATTTGGIYTEVPSSGVGVGDAIKDIIDECGGVGPPACDFTATPRTGTAPLRVQFTDLSTGEIESWAWDIDNDGVTDSTQQNPSYTYTAAGKYTVSLTATGPGGSCTETKVAYITVREFPTEVSEPANLKAAYLLISPEQVMPNQEVEISINIGNDGGTAGTRSIALYINDNLEDSQTVSVSPGSAKNVVFTVTRTEPGTYQVLLEGNEGQFTVLGTADAGHWAGPLGTGGIIAIVVIVIALVLGLVFILKRE